MKQILLILAVVMGQSVLAADQAEIIDKAIRTATKNKDGEVLGLHLEHRKLTRGTGKISDAGLRMLVGHEQLAQLELLYLGGTQITDAGLSHVAKLKKLEVLSLRKCQKITNGGLEALYGCNNLTELRLQDAKVTKAGVAQLRRELPKCRIFSNPKK